MSNPLAGKGPKALNRFHVRDSGGRHNKRVCACFRCSLWRKRTFTLNKYRELQLMVWRTVRDNARLSREIDGYLG